MNHLGDGELGDDLPRLPVGVAVAAQGADLLHQRLLGLLGEGELLPCLLLLLVVNLCQNRLEPAGRKGDNILRHTAKVDAETGKVRVKDKAHQNPVGVAGRAARHIGRNGSPLGEGVDIAGQLFLQVVLHRGDDELLLCAGQRDIEDAHLLREHRALQFQLERLHRHGGVLLAGDKVPGTAGKSQLGVQQHVAAQVLGVEPLGGVAQENHREFQPFGVVDAHDAHRVGTVGDRAGAGPVLPAADHLVHKPQKSRDTLLSSRLILLRILDEQAQVRLAHLPILHGEHQIPQAGALDQLLDQLVRRAGGGDHAQLRKGIQELLAKLLAGLFLLAQIFPGGDFLAV